MIQEIHTITPQIDFGFGQTVKRVTAGTPVTIWLSTLYNRDAYSFSLLAPGTVTKISDYEYTVTHNTAGVYSPILTVTHKATGLRLESNTLNLTIS
ncbi:MAG: hypothetical protein DI539_00215 [Flavobacterium psychrophilum]|nr:MAG: hypothetical protein DI539_00215 [Flavobacterium psychrophilum]